MAGLCLEEFKELLASRSIRIEVGASNEESLERLRKAGLLSSSEKDLAIERILISGDINEGKSHL
jgi:hypothetical protein